MSYESANTLTDGETADAPANVPGHFVRSVGNAYSQMERFERGLEDCVRRNPVSSMLIAAGCGAMIGSLVLVALTDRVRSTSRGRSWTRFF